MAVSIDSTEQTSNPISHLLSSISSYDGNVLLAAIISLLLVILFVLLLHVYSKWFLAQARYRSRSSSLSQVFHPDRFRHFHAFTFDATFPATPSKGLDSSVISSIPLFVFNVEEHSKLGLECVICLSLFEDNEVGRNLPKCGHGFHVECIDMWLNSHSNCPLCRAPVLGTDTDSQTSSLET
ncbi:RING/U-box superfamily protein [Hibiscus syriacus]|uniref:RING-type E3 ubiquitin transferase n=1 Tax=Hibiscus syriacus TaxID=106335 RepID=A0A6A3C6V5_HIBSY|nr:RING/U-box superfamily protein [Hibiscus syriacus]